MEKILKEVSDVVHTILIAAIFIALPLVLFILITSNSSLLWNIRSFVVLTGSMEPFIPTGSVVFVQKQNSYNVGDVVTYSKNNISVTHRVVRIEDSKYQTKGDANNTADADLVLGDKILGKAFVHIPLIGKFILFLRTPLGFFIFVVLPIILFVMFEFKRIKKELEKDIEKKLKKKYEDDES